MHKRFFLLSAGVQQTMPVKIEIQCRAPIRKNSEKRLQHTHNMSAKGIWDSCKS